MRVITIAILFNLIAVPNVMTQTTDSYADFCLEFMLMIEKNSDITEILSHFNDSINNDTLRSNIYNLMNDISGKKQQVKYHITKINRPFSYYNINIYKPNSQESIGDVRFVFKSEEDYLIDSWIYLREKKESSDNEYDTKPNIPLPPLSE